MPLGKNFGRTFCAAVLVAEADGLTWQGKAIMIDPDQTSHGLALTIGHELAHVRGITDELEADRIGAMLARDAARSR
jgi:hypothetical protein